MKRTAIIVAVGIGIALTYYQVEAQSPRKIFGDAGIDQWTPAAFSPDGKMILARGFRPDSKLGPPYDQVLRLWDVASVKVIREYRYSNEISNQYFEQVAFAPDGKCVFACGQGLPLIMWDAQTAKEIRTFGEDQCWVSCFALTPDGKFAITANAKQELAVWELVSGKLVKSVSVRDHYVPDSISNILFSKPTDSLIVCDIATISIWRFPSLDFVVMGTSLERVGPKQFPLPYPIALMSFSLGSNGRTIFYSEPRGPMYELDIATAKVKRTIDLKAVNRIHVLTVSPKGDKIMTTGFHGETVVYSLPEGKVLKRIPGYGNVQFSPDGKMALTFTKDGRMMLWDLEEEIEKRREKE